MVTKKIFACVLIFGVLLALLSIPTSAYSLVLIFRLTDLSPYAAWALSALPASFIVLFPLGLFTRNDHPWLYGTVIGCVAVLALYAYELAQSFLPGGLFYSGCFALVAFSGLSSLLGFHAKKIIFKNNFPASSSPSLRGNGP